MIRLDSIKIQAGAEVISEFDKTKFLHNVSTDADDRVIFDKYVIPANMLPCGLNQVQFNAQDHTLMLSLSSKILSDNYYDLINIDTIDQVFDAINDTRYIKIDKSNIDKFQLHTADFTTNVKGDHRPDQYIDALRLMVTNDRYIVETYKGTGDNKNKTGLVCRGTQRTFKERLLFYNKLADLQKDKRLLQAVKNPGNLIDKFRNVLRVESNTAQHRKIKEYAGTNDNGLLSVLRSDAINPNYRLFQKIKKLTGIQTDLFDLGPDVKLYEIEKLRGRQAIVQELGCDMNLIREFIGTYVKGNLSKYMREYKQVCIDMMIKESSKIDDNALVIELENYLRDAV